MRGSIDRRGNTESNLKVDALSITPPVLQKGHSVSYKKKKEYFER